MRYAATYSMFNLMQSTQFTQMPFPIRTIRSASRHCPQHIFINFNNLLDSLTGNDRSHGGTAIHGHYDSTLEDKGQSSRSFVHPFFFRQTLALGCGKSGRYYGLDHNCPPHNKVCRILMLVSIIVTNTLIN